MLTDLDKSEKHTDCVVGPNLSDRKLTDNELISIFLTVFHEKTLFGCS